MAHPRTGLIPRHPKQFSVYSRKFVWLTRPNASTVYAEVVAVAVVEVAHTRGVKGEARHGGDLRRGLSSGFRRRLVDVKLEVGSFAITAARAW